MISGPKHPVPLHLRLAATIKSGVTSAALHAQQITTLQSQSALYSNLVPGSWEAITLENGWSNVAGSVPAQVRLITTSTIQIIGNIQGGTVTDGTVIGTLTAGFYNATHSHNVSLTAVAGAESVNNAVTQGQLMDKGGSVNNLNVTLPVIQIPTSNHTINSTPFTLGPSGVQFQNANNNNPGTLQNNGNTTLNNDMLHNNQTTPINFNSGTLIIGTDGTLKISNLNSAVTQISFHENGIPLFT